MPRKLFYQLTAKAVSGQMLPDYRTAKEVIELYRQRHYQGLRNLLKGLAE